MVVVVVVVAAIVCAEVFTLVKSVPDRRGSDFFLREPHQLSEILICDVVVTGKPFIVGVCTVC